MADDLVDPRKLGVQLVPVDPERSADVVVTHAGAAVHPEVNLAFVGHLDAAPSAVPDLVQVLGR